MARSKVQLSEIGVHNVKIRHMVSGGVLVEIPGEESAAKADDLANKLKSIFPKDGEVRISRPVKRSEVRICGLDASIHPEELREAVAINGGCNKDEVKIGEIRKRSPRGMGAAWVLPGCSAKRPLRKLWRTRKKSWSDGLQQESSVKGQSHDLLQVHGKGTHCVQLHL